MEKIKEKLHIGSSRRKSQPENDLTATSGTSDTTHSTTFNSGPGHAAAPGRSGHAIEDTYGA